MLKTKQKNSSHTRAHTQVPPPEVIVFCGFYYFFKAPKDSYV